MKIARFSYRHIHKKIFALAFGVLMLLIPDKIWSQSYGLGFNGQNFSKDLRTGIDLSPNDYLTFNDEFELRFKMLLRPNEKMYFGYIVRIVDIKERNVDLIFNYKSSTESSIELICGQNISRIKLKSDFNLLCNEWTEFRLKLDLINNRVSLQMPDKNFEGNDSGANLTGNVKFLFGVNEFSHFKTTDVPAMEIKDISIYEKDNLKYNWPLDETEGNYSKDKIRKKKAEIKNPVWLMPEHNTWKKIYSSTLMGNCEIAYSQKDEKIYLLGDEKMDVFSAKTNSVETITYKNKAQNLLPGRQAFYNPTKNTVISYDIDQETISEFDFTSLTWKQEVPKNLFPTIFLHHNQYFSDATQELFLIGGYGQHEYKNLVQIFDFQNRNWQKVIPSGDVFNPRYLSSSATLNDTVFILGGYGSLSGKQILNPRNYYDLIAYSIKHNTFKKLYAFNPPADDLCFSNSMVIDPGSRTYYALTFSVIKFDGHLQLVKGFLDNPEIKLISDKIPYSFHDIKSFSTLYQCKSSKKLIAATLLLNDHNQTEFNLYSIAFPPNEYTEKVLAEKSYTWVWIYLSGFIILLSLLYLFLHKRKKFRKQFLNFRNNKFGNNLYRLENESEKVENESVRNSVFFFGGLQVCNNLGKDVTNRFSPLVKELYLLIWLNSIKNNKGISSEKMTELLWFDKDEKSASNNRAVNIAKVKQIISELDSCTLSHKTTYWKIEFDESVIHNDYTECLKLAASKKGITKEKISKIIYLTNKGPFLLNSAYEWLDEFKADLSNRVIDILVDFALTQKIEEDPDFMLNLADAIFNFDVVNEEAMLLKSKVLTFLGKHSLASNAYSKFAKEYKSLYGEYYTKSFNDVINNTTFN